MLSKSAEERKTQYLNELKKEHELNKLVIEFIKKDIIPKIISEAPEIKNLALDMYKKRDKLIRLFKEARFQEACVKCKGKCCEEGIYKYTRSIELISFLLLSDSVGNFSLPEPDWKYLFSQMVTWEEKRPDGELTFGVGLPRCMFLGSSGCLLGKWKPIMCLGYATCFENEQGRNYIETSRLAVKRKIAEISERLSNLPVFKTEKMFFYPDFYPFGSYSRHCL